MDRIHSGVSHRAEHFSEPCCGNIGASPSDTGSMDIAYDNFVSAWLETPK